jgi:hypothetical protein
MKFHDPDRFDPTRSDNEHLRFGSGIHLCFGGPLARIEAQSALGALIPLLDTARLAQDPPPYRHSAKLRGPPPPARSALIAGPCRQRGTRVTGVTVETAPKTVRKTVPGTPNAITGAQGHPGPATEHLPSAPSVRVEV